MKEEELLKETIEGAVLAFVVSRRADQVVTGILGRRVDTAETVHAIVCVLSSIRELLQRLGAPDHTFDFLLHLSEEGKGEVKYASTDVMMPEDFATTGDGAAQE